MCGFFAVKFLCARKKIAKEKFINLTSEKKIVAFKVRLHANCECFSSGWDIFRIHILISGGGFLISAIYLFFACCVRRTILRLFQRPNADFPIRNEEKHLFDRDQIAVTARILYANASKSSSGWFSIFLIFVDFKWPNGFAEIVESSLIEPEKLWNHLHVYSMLYCGVVWCVWLISHHVIDLPYTNQR